MTFDMGLMTVVVFLVVWQLFWQTHVPLVIYATCAGFVLATTWGPELVGELARFGPFFGTDIGQSSVNLFLFLLPPALTSYQFRGTMSHRMLQQFVPALFWVLFIVAFALRLLPIGTRQLLLDGSHILLQIDSFSSWIVLLVVGVASIELLSQHDLLNTRPKRGKRGKKDD
jgi:hypothetical protein